jgi:hypothetical protein
MHMQRHGRMQQMEIRSKEESDAGATLFDVVAMLDPAVVVPNCTLRRTNQSEH